MRGRLYILVPGCDSHTKFFKLRKKERERERFGSKEPLFPSD